MVTPVTAEPVVVAVPASVGHAVLYQLPAVTLFVTLPTSGTRGVDRDTTTGSDRRNIADYRAVVFAKLIELFALVAETRVTMPPTVTVPVVAMPAVFTAPPAVMAKSLPTVEAPSVKTSASTRETLPAAPVVVTITFSKLFVNRVERDGARASVQRRRLCCQRQAGRL